MRHTIIGKPARDKLLEGINVLANAVKVTLGPKGRMAVIKADGTPIATNDGVTIARQIQLADPAANAGAELIREAAAKTADAAGDGTTTATILAQSLINDGLQLVDEGANPILLRRGMAEAIAVATAVVDRVKVSKVSNKTIGQIASISSRSPEIGQMIADLHKELGDNGYITIERSQVVGIEKEVVSGMRVNAGFMSPHMSSDGIKTYANDTYILVTDQVLETNEQLVPLFEILSEKKSTSIVIFCDDCRGEALATFVMNRLNGQLAGAVIKLPAFGSKARSELMMDIAAFTGAKVVSRSIGTATDEMDLDSLGHAKRVEISDSETVIIKGSGKKEDIAARLNYYTKTIAAEKKRDYSSEVMAYRLDELNKAKSSLTSGVGVIHVGAATEAELNERFYLIEDAIEAVMAAKEDGIVPGGGRVLIQAIKDIDPLLHTGHEDEKLGAALVVIALQRPLAQIVLNTGIKEAQEVVDKVAGLPDTQGFNAATGQYVDLIEAGIIDPAKVVKQELQNSLSVAGTVLTCDVLIVDGPNA